MLILVAVLMGLTALAASVSPPPERPRDERRGAPTASPTPPPVASGRVIDRRLDATGGTPARIVAERGDTVLLQVEGDVVDSVSIEGLSEIDAIDPSSPAHFELYADTPGSYPIELLDSGRRIGVLAVE